jgi:hypothetical protein
MKEYQMTIIVEGEKFLPIVKAVLADAVGDMEVDWHASDYSALISAISALLRRRHPVLLVLNSEFNDPATGEEAWALAHQGLYDVADREFWEVAMAEPNLEAWHVGNGREVRELMAQDRDLHVTTHSFAPLLANLCALGEGLVEPGLVFRFSVPWGNEEPVPIGNIPESLRKRFTDSGIVLDQRAALSEDTRPGESVVTVNGKEYRVRTEYGNFL